MHCPHCKKWIDTPRTNSQNSALHKGLGMLAEQLNTMGLDMRTLLKPEYNLPWTVESTKTHLWKPFMKAMTNKKSTTELKKANGEITLIWKTLMRELGEKHGVEYIRFPSKTKCCQSIDCVCGKNEYE